MEGFLKPTNQKFITIINRRVLKPTDPRFVYKHAWNGATSLLVKDSKIKKYYNLYKKRMHKPTELRYNIHITFIYTRKVCISLPMENTTLHRRNPSHSIIIIICEC